MPKSKQPGREGKSFAVLKKVVSDPLIQAKMKLIEYLASKLNEFLRGFQTDQPMLPFLCDTLQKNPRSIMNMFISTSAMGEANTLIKLLKIDVTDSSIYKSCDASDIGMCAKLYVTWYKMSPALKESVLQNFWKGVRCTLSALVSHMFDKSPLKYV